jgi:hypothetical protein
MSPTKAANDTCDTAATKDFTKVWAAEGLGTFTLPADFDTLSTAYQLLAISDLERVARGLTPMQGLTAYLDGLAQQGADGDGDPPFPSPFGSYGSSGGSNWAGAGNSALLDDFYWMYDDGLGSFNGDCYQGHTSGCWGHRDNILMSASAPAVMGAAVATDSTYGSSMAEEFIGGYRKLATDPLLAPTWATIAATIPSSGSPTPVSLSTAAVSLSVDTGATGAATVTVTGPAAGAAVTDIVSAGSRVWSVAPTSCTLLANASCVLHLTLAPTAPGSAAGVLTVTDGSGTQTVSLTGAEAKPSVGITTTRNAVSKGGAVTLTGGVATGMAHTPITGESLVLQRKLTGGRWADLATKRSGSGGLAIFRRHAKKTAKYRAQVRWSGGAASSVAIKVKVS